MKDELIAAAKVHGDVRITKTSVSIEVKHTPEGFNPRTQWIYIRLQENQLFCRFYYGIVDKTCVPEFWQEEYYASSADKLVNKDSTWNLQDGTRVCYNLTEIVQSVFEDLLDELHLRTVTPYTLTKLAASRSRKTFSSILEKMKLWDEQLYWPLVGSIAELHGYSRQEVKTLFRQMQRSINAAKELSQ